MLLRTWGIGILQRNGPLKNGPLRNKLRRLFKTTGITRALVDEYLGEEKRNNDRNFFIILPRQRGTVKMNGEQMTARKALNRFPLLSEYLQRKRVLIIIIIIIELIYKQ